MSRGSERIIEPKTRIRRCDDGNAKCSASSQLAPPSVFSACMPPFTTPSTFNAILSRAQRFGSSEPKRPASGRMPSPPRDRASGVGLVFAHTVKLTVPRQRLIQKPRRTDLQQQKTAFRTYSGCSVLAVGTALHAPNPTLTGLSGIGRVGWLAAIPVWCENEKMRTAREYLRRDWLCFANTWVCLYQSCHNAPYAS